MQFPQGTQVKRFGPALSLKYVTMMYGVFGVRDIMEEGVSPMDGEHPFSSPDTVPFPKQDISVRL